VIEPAPSARMAATVSSSTPATRPRHPAWATPITPSALARATGAQSAESTARAAPALALTAAVRDLPRRCSGRPHAHDLGPVDLDQPGPRQVHDRPAAARDDRIVARRVGQVTLGPPGPADQGGAERDGSGTRPPGGERPLWGPELGHEHQFPGYFRKDGDVEVVVVVGQADAGDAVLPRSRLGSKPEAQARLGRRLAGLVPPVEPGRDDRDADLVAHGVVDDPGRR